MRAEINRFNDIMYNVNGILSEDKNFTTKHTSRTPSIQAISPPIRLQVKDFKTTKQIIKSAI